MRVFALFAVLLCSVAAYGQQFKDPENLGPDVPTPQIVVDDMLRLANIKPGETVYDLGCGDGRVMITAVQRYGVKAVGIEMSRDIYDSTVATIKAKGLQDRIKVIHGDALRADLTPADVVTFYFLTSSNARLKPLFARMRPGSRLVSHDYEVPGWKPAQVDRVKVNGTTHLVYLYEIKPHS